MKMRMRVKEIGKIKEIILPEHIKSSLPECLESLIKGETVKSLAIVLKGTMENTTRQFEIFPIQQINAICGVFYTDIKLFNCYCVDNEGFYFNIKEIREFFKHFQPTKKMEKRVRIYFKIKAKCEALKEKNKLLNQEERPKEYLRWLKVKDKLHQEGVFGSLKERSEIFLDKTLKITELLQLVKNTIIPLYIHEIKERKIGYSNKTEHYTDEKDCYVLYNQKIYQLDKFSYSIDQIKELVNSLEVREIQDFVNMSKRTAAIKTGTRSPRVEISEEVRQIVWIRDQGRCVRCHTNKKLVYAHIIPHVDGGSNTARNIEMLCEDCNNKQGANVQYEGDLFQ